MKNNLQKTLSMATEMTKADETGIELIESEQTAPSIIGYYDLNGHKLSKPQHGITIVRYSDGTTCKILRK